MILIIHGISEQTIKHIIAFALHQDCMLISDLQDRIHSKLFEKLRVLPFQELRPSQEKAINAGLLEDNNLLICTPTGSGKTLAAEIGALNAIYNKKGKALYIVPLKALATEKYKDFCKKYPDVKIALSIGDRDSADHEFAAYDLIITVSEKLDSLLRHQCPWLKDVKVVVVDEIHLLNDPNRGPTLEVVLTLLRHLLTNIQIIGLSATIGNPKELATWLEAKLVIDNWRPVELHHGIYHEGSIEFY